MPSKELEAEVACPQCKALYGKVYRKEIAEGIWIHEPHPDPMPQRCTPCEVVLERKRAN